VKTAHRADVFTYSVFAPHLDIDFNSVLWKRPGGNVLIDPLAMIEHDEKHLVDLGGAAIIVVTNSDHLRHAGALAPKLGAKVFGPSAERGDFDLACDRWLKDQDEVVPGLIALEMVGSKTPGELALVLEDRTLITGDLIRAHRAGRLMLLPDSSGASKAIAIQSLRRVAAMDQIDAVLVGDGWSIFRDGQARLRELLAHVEGGLTG
jgi:hypothetical protein